MIIGEKKELMKWFIGGNVLNGVKSKRVSLFARDTLLCWMSITFDYRGVVKPYGVYPAKPGVLILHLRTLVNAGYIQRIKGRGEYVVSRKGEHYLQTLWTKLDLTRKAQYETLAKTWEAQ